VPFVVDATGRGLPTATLARRGLIATLLLVVAVALLLMQYRGAFRSVFPAVALVADVGDGLAAGADVKLRGALVGTVGGVAVRPADGPGGQDLHEIDLQLRPDLADGIPAGVTARVVPTNVFGAPSVELLDPARPTGVMLARGGVIRGDTSQGTLQLQTVLNRLNTLLRAVRPAELNAALTNIAQGLRGRGARIGSITGRLDSYLTTLNGHTDDFSADLRLLGPDLRALADDAPQLLDTVDNAVVTTRTIAAQRQHLVDTLTGATRTADTLDDFLSDNNDRVVRLVRDGARVTRTLAPQRDLIARSLISLGKGAGQFGVAINPRTHGALNLQFVLTPFQPYTAADCPRYPGAAGPNCGDRIPPPGALPPSFPFYQGVPTPPAPLPAPPEAFTRMFAPGGDRGGQAGGRSDPDGARPPAPGGLPGMFPSMSPSGFRDAGPGGSVGPVGSPAEVGTINALLGTPGGGSAGALLLGPLLRGAAVAVGA
jgi:virulence factor Mce-like protein